MKKPTFVIKKWLVRGLVVIGAMIGITACQHTKKYNLDDDASISSSESSENSDISEVSDISEISDVEDVYGPPIEDIETVYGPPSYFDEIEGKPEVIDEPMSSKED